LKEEDWKNKSEYFLELHLFNRKASFDILYTYLKKGIQPFPFLGMWMYYGLDRNENVRHGNGTVN